MSRQCRQLYTIIFPLCRGTSAGGPPSPLPFLCRRRLCFWVVCRGRLLLWVLESLFFILGTQKLHVRQVDAFPFWDISFISLPKSCECYLHGKCTSPGALTFGRFGITHVVLAFFLVVNSRVRLNTQTSEQNTHTHTHTHTHTPSPACRRLHDHLAEVPRQSGNIIAYNWRHCRGMCYLF